MRRLCAISLLLATVALFTPSMAQRGHRLPPVVFEDETKLPADAKRGPDPKLLMQQATELQQLSNAIPDDIDKLSKGVLSKDLGERLKKIQKLAKQLRQEVQ
jgi:hypothetical protein